MPAYILRKSTRFALNIAQKQSSPDVLAGLRENGGKVKGRKGAERREKEGRGKEGKGKRRGEMRTGDTIRLLSDFLTTPIPVLASTAGNRTGDHRVASATP